jgi:hypothetical protein
MRRMSGAVLEAVWDDVSVSQPCPCCAAEQGCSVLADGEFVRCLTEVSERPVSGGGWLHRSAEIRRATVIAS